MAEEKNAHSPMRSSLEHLPEKKQRELARIVEVIHEEFEDALKGGTSDFRSAVVFSKSSGLALTVRREGGGGYHAINATSQTNWFLTGDWNVTPLQRVLTNYSPASHNLKHLRRLADGQDWRIAEVWPRDHQRHIPWFNILNEAYA